MQTDIDDEQGWASLAAGIADCLAAMDKGEYLIVGHKAVNYFVQFAAEGNNGILAEAVSNQFIEPLNAALTVEDYERMAALGWNGATCPPPIGRAARSPKGRCPNFSRKFRPPVELRELAELAVRTLREVYGIRTILELEYKAFSEAGTSIRFPLLSIGRRRGKRS